MLTLDDFSLLGVSQENCTYSRAKGLKQVWNSSQRNAFLRIKCGILAHNNEILRFMTLTSAEEMLRDINEVFRCMKTMIKRYTPYRLMKEGYIKKRNVRFYYPNKNPFSKLNFEYIKIKTSEGNGVLHIPFFGDYLPYNFLCDLFSYYSGFAWNIDIRKVRGKALSNRDKRKLSYYVMNQYVVNQSDENGESSYKGYSTSWNWIFRGFTKWYNEFKSTLRSFDYVERNKMLARFLLCKGWIPPPEQVLLDNWDVDDSFIKTRLELDFQSWDDRYNVKRWMNRGCGPGVAI